MVEIATNQSRCVTQKQTNMLEDSGISNDQELKKPIKLAAKNVINTMPIGLWFEKNGYLHKVSIEWRCYLWTSLEAWSQGPLGRNSLFFFSIVTFVLFYFIFIIISYLFLLKFC